MTKNKVQKVLQFYIKAIESIVELLYNGHPWDLRN